jgi:hypothetical protein
MDVQVMRPSLAYRLAFTAVAVFLTAGLWWNVQRYRAGDLEWTTANRIGLPILLVLACASVLGTALIWTSRIWIDPVTLTFHRCWLWQHHRRPLDSPTTVHLKHQPPVPGQSVVGQWKATVRRADEPEVVVATPWVPDMAALAERLQEPLRRNPALAADSQTRAWIEDPGTMPGAAGSA